jgi:hypothetical protein
MEDFLERSVLPHTTPRYSVIVVDNASIHQSPRVRELCTMYKVQLISIVLNAARLLPLAAAKPPFVY